MAWIYLAIAGLFEVAWAVGLKSTHGFTRPLPSLLVGLAMAASMGLLSLAVRELPIGTAYAVWTGIGTLGAAAFGMPWIRIPAPAISSRCCTASLCARR